MRPYTDGPVEIHPDTPKPDYRKVAMQRRRTLTLRAPEADHRLPEFLRPPRVPLYIWDQLRYRSAGDKIEAVIDDEVYATIMMAEAQDETRNLGNLLAARVQRHYLLKVKPELLVC